MKTYKCARLQSSHTCAHARPRCVMPSTHTCTGCPAASASNLTAGASAPAKPIVSLGSLLQECSSSKCSDGGVIGLRRHPCMCNTHQSLAPVDQSRRAVCATHRTCVTNTQRQPCCVRHPPLKNAERALQRAQHLPEAVVGAHQAACRDAVLARLLRTPALAAHQVHHNQAGRAAHARATVHQGGCGVTAGRGRAGQQPKCISRQGSGEF